MCVKIDSRRGEKFLCFVERRRVITLTTLWAASAQLLWPGDRKKICGQTKSLFTPKCQNQESRCCKALCFEVQTKQHSYQRTATISPANNRLTFRFMAGISMMLVIQTTPEFEEATWRNTEGSHFLHRLLSKTPPANMNHVTGAWLLTMWPPSSSPCPYSDPLLSHREGEGTANI